MLTNVSVSKIWHQKSGVTYHHESGAVHRLFFLNDCQPLQVNESSRRKIRCSAVSLQLQPPSPNQPSLYATPSQAVSFAGTLHRNVAAGGAVSGTAESEVC